MFNLRQGSPCALCWERLRVSGHTQNVELDLAPASSYALPLRMPLPWGFTLQKHPLKLCKPAKLYQGKRKLKRREEGIQSPKVTSGVSQWHCHLHGKAP
jgi:hypothetical protein